MSEERTQYTTPDEVADRLSRQEAYIAQLERTNDGYNMIQHRHAETIAEQARRIAELEATVQRLEAEAQSRVDHTPVTLLRYIVNSHPTLPVNDRIAARQWLDSLDGDA